MYNTVSYYTTERRYEETDGFYDVVDEYAYQSDSSMNYIHESYPTRYESWYEMLYDAVYSTVWEDTGNILVTDVLYNADPVFDYLEDIERELVFSINTGSYHIDMNVCKFISIMQDDDNRSYLNTIELFEQLCKYLGGVING